MRGNMDPRGGMQRGAARFERGEGRKKEVLWRLTKFVMNLYR